MSIYTCMTLQEELQQIDQAISNILTAGQSFSLSSASGSGSSRQTTFANLDQLYARKAQLELKLGITKPVSLGAGW